MIIKKPYQPILSVGDKIQFNFDGMIKKGNITVVGKYGYWINDGFYNGSIRCPFGNEK